MPDTAARRAFLLGRFREPLPLRPPGAVDADAFRARCTSCGDCLRACPEAILLSDAEGRPMVSFAEAACTFCGACAEACRTGALEAGLAFPWRARVGASCLSMNGVACRACEDACDQQAIRFQLSVGGRAFPLLDRAACNGCGACVGDCPVDAIEMTPLRPEEARPC